MIIFLTDSFPLCLIYLKAGFRVCGKFNILTFIFWFFSLCICSCTWSRWPSGTRGKVWSKSHLSSFPDFTAKFRSNSPRCLSQSKALSPCHIWPSEFILEQRGKMMAKRFPVWEQQQCLLQSCSPCRTCAKSPWQQRAEQSWQFSFQPLIFVDGRKKNQNLFHFSSLIGKNCFISLF